MIDVELVERAHDVDLLSTALNLGAKLKRVSATELAGPCPRHAGRDRFSVNVRKLVWNCRGSEGGNDSISLAAHVLGLSFHATVAFLTGEDVARGPQSARGRVSGPDSPPIPVIVQSPPAASPSFVERLIADIVRELGPVRGTPGEAYFRDTRKIDTEAIADVLEQTDAIGWHPSCLFREEGHPLDGERLGCVVGVMTDPITAKPTGAISRTYIHESRKLGKAKTLGSPVGVVRLSADEDVLSGLNLVEGIETGLVALAKGFRPAWACGSANVMAAFPVLAGIETLTFFADHDASGTGQRAANEAAARWRASGREARVFLRKLKGDFNDAAKELDQ